MKDYFDKGFFSNPIAEYLKWIIGKIFYQSKYWGKHLRISYMANVSNSRFGKYNFIGRRCNISNSNIGDFTYVSENSVITDATIGKYCSIGPNIRIGPGKHPTHKFVSTHPSLYSNPSNLIRNFVPLSYYKYKKEVIIGNDVWIGSNVVIANGVTLGDGVIVAANSVVTKDVEPYSIIAGIPAVIMRKRFEENEVEFLANYKWWDKSEKFIQDNIKAWWSITDFVSTFKS